MVDCSTYLFFNSTDENKAGDINSLWNLLVLIDILYIRHILSSPVSLIVAS